MREFRENKKEVKETPEKRPIDVEMLRRAMRDIKITFEDRRAIDAQALVEAEKYVEGVRPTGVVVKQPKQPVKAQDLRCASVTALFGEYQAPVDAKLLCALGDNSQNPQQHPASFITPTGDTIEVEDMSPLVNNMARVTPLEILQMCGYTNATGCGQITSVSKIPDKFIMDVAGVAVTNEDLSKDELIKLAIQIHAVDQWLDKKLEQIGELSQ